MRNAALIVLIPALAAAASSPLRFADLPNSQFKQVVPLANGEVLVVGTYSETSCRNTLYGCDQPPSPYFEVWDASGGFVESYLNPLGSGRSTITCAAVDSNGNILIAGETNSDDFTLVNPLYSEKPPYQKTSYIAKIGPSGIVFSTFWGGATGEIGVTSLSPPTNIAADNMGNVYIAGPTTDLGVPVTGPTLGTGVPVLATLQPITLAFVAKISADGSQLVYSHFLGGNKPACNGDDCNEFTAITVPNAIAVDAAGNLTVAGSTTATNFPVTAAAYQTSGNEFISRVSADGSQFIWSTFVGTPMAPEGAPGTSVNSIALDSADNVWFTGSTFSAITATPGALQPTLPPTLSQFGPLADGFAAKLSSDGSKLLYATNLGGSYGATIAGVVLDSSGNVWITGNNKSPEFPGMPNTPPAGLDFALELNSSGTAIQQIFQLVPGTATQQPAFDSDGNLLLAGSSGVLLRLNPATVLTAPAVLAVANAAALRSSPVLAPGEIVSLFGVGFAPSSGSGSGSGGGPTLGIVSGPDSNGLYPKQLGGVTVQFTSSLADMPVLSAPILFAAANQINFQVPFGIPAQFTMTVTTPSGALPPLAMLRGGSVGIFQQSGTNYAAALNSDGSINSASNPASLGSIISIFVTGLGPGSQQPADGAIWPAASPIYLNEVQVAEPMLNQGYLSTIYTGTAPGEINGLAQINVQLNGYTQIAVIELLGPNSGTSNIVTVYAH